MAVSFVAIFAVEAPELTPPRVVGGVFGDAALPRAAENPPSLLKTRVRVRRQCRRIGRQLQLKAIEDNKQPIAYIGDGELWA